MAKYTSASARFEQDFARYYWSRKDARKAKRIARRINRKGEKAMVKREEGEW